MTEVEYENEEILDKPNMLGAKHLLGNAFLKIILWDENYDKTYSDSNRFGFPLSNRMDILQQDAGIAFELVLKILAGYFNGQTLQKYSHKASTIFPRIDLLIQEMIIGMFREYDSEWSKDRILQFLDELVDANAKFAGISRNNNQLNIRSQYGPVIDNLTKIWYKIAKLAIKYINKNSEKLEGVKVSKNGKEITVVYYGYEQLQYYILDEVDLRSDEFKQWIEAQKQNV